MVEETAEGKGDGGGSPAAVARPYALAAIVAGFRANVLVALVVAAYGIVMGAIAATKGISLAELSIMSTLVLAGAAQLITVDMWTEPVPVGAIIATTAVVNLRYLLIGASLRPVFRGCSLRQKLAGIHLVADENWAITMDAHKKGYGSPGFLLGGGLAILVFWLAGGAIGLVFGNRLPEPEVLGLDFAITAVFISLLLGFWRGASRDLLPWGVTIAVAVATWYLVPGKWYILAGALAGAVAAAFGKEADDGAV
jgi:4-azaleucine resistance transporter AzlC